MNQAPMQFTLLTNHEMKKSILKFSVYATLLFTVSASLRVLAQTPARNNPASIDKITKALIDVESNMDSLRFHRIYISAMGYSNPDVLNQYESWFKKYPQNANIPLAIGTVFYGRTMPEAKEFLLKAAAMNPENAKVWFMLASDAGIRGQNDLLSEYLRKATSAEPSNAIYAYAYAQSFEKADRNIYKDKVFDFVKRFPETESGAWALYGLATSATDPEEKILYYEELRKLYPPQKFKWTASRLDGLVDTYLQTDPEKALTVIREVGGGGYWDNKKQVAELFIEINKLEQDKNYTEAIVKLDKLKISGSNDINDLIALKKAFLRDKIGDVKSAYDSLFLRFAELPTDALYNALESYGKKMDKDKEQVAKDIETIRMGKATVAYPFKLGLYTSKDTLNLSVLKGKVVLLTFWFPACTPCLAEFPHFQKVVDSFKGDSLVYIGINVLPSQDGFVLPFMENRKFSFIPLRGSVSFARQNYGVQGQPENFLIDKDGKIVFKDFRIDNSNHRTLELMISSLLEKEPAKE